MIEMVCICGECEACDVFYVRKKTKAKNVFKRAGALHRKAAPKCKTQTKDLGVMSAFEAHCGGLID